MDLMKLYLKILVVCNLLIFISCADNSLVSRLPKELREDLASQYYSGKDLASWQLYLSYRFNLNENEKNKHYSALIYALENNLGEIVEWNNGINSYGKIRTLTSYQNEFDNLCKTYETMVMKSFSKNSIIGSACYVKNQWIFHK